MAKKAATDQIPPPAERTRKASPRLTAGPCQREPKHTNTRIHKTTGRVRHCVCDDCGHTWKQTGPFADQLRGYAYKLAETLAGTAHAEVGGESVLIIEAKTARKIVDELRRLATT